jgi:hypothetical protein
MDVGALSELGRKGILATRTDEDLLITTYALLPSAVTFRLAYICERPVPVCRRLALARGEAVQMSRLDLLQALHFQGGAPRLRCEPWEAGAALEYERAALVDSVSKWYLVALLAREDILAKGCARIHHRFPGSYYQALVKLADFTAVAALAARDPPGTAREFAALLPKTKGGGAPASADAEGESDEEQGDGEGAVAAQSAEAPVPIQFAEGLSAPKGFRDPIPLPGTEHRGPALVHWDNFSHASGQLRGYVMCSLPGHDRCLKYVQLNVAGTRLRVAAFLAAWLDMGPGYSREAHSGRDVLPDPDAVDAWETRLSELGC